MEDLRVQELIEQVYRLAVAADEYEGDINSIILTDQVYDDKTCLTEIIETMMTSKE